MNSHPYLRAYMAGICLPTMLLLVATTGFTFARFVYDIPIPIERIVVFPMAVVPNAWGVWNMLFLRLGSRRWPLGLHGAVLPVLLIPLGVALARLLDITIITARVIAVFAPVAIILYYLAWKYLVGYFNRVLGISYAK
jgi:hypothetical protein